MPKSGDKLNGAGKPRENHPQLAVSSEDHQGDSDDLDAITDSDSEEIIMESDSGQDGNESGQDEDESGQDENESEQPRKKLKIGMCRRRCIPSRDAGSIDSSSVPSNVFPLLACHQDPKATREQQKTRKLTRRMQKPNYDVVEKAKRLCEVARRKQLDNIERETALKQLTELVKGRCSDLALRHDSSRVLQIIIKRGKTEERDMIANELMGKYVELSKSPYGKFLVQKLFSYW
jgi:pumilio family protein 6